MQWIILISGAALDFEALAVAYRRLGEVQHQASPPRLMVQGGQLRGTVTFNQDARVGVGFSDEQLALIRQIIPQPCFSMLQFRFPEDADLAISRLTASGPVLVDNDQGLLLSLDEIKHRLSLKQGWLGNAPVSDPDEAETEAETDPIDAVDVVEPDSGADDSPNAETEANADDEDSDPPFSFTPPAPPAPAPAPERPSPPPTPGPPPIAGQGTPLPELPAAIAPTPAPAPPPAAELDELHIFLRQAPWPALLDTVSNLLATPGSDDSDEITERHCWTVFGLELIAIKVPELQDDHGIPFSTFSSGIALDHRFRDHPPQEDAYRQAFAHLLLLRLRSDLDPQALLVRNLQQVIQPG